MPIDSLTKKVKGFAFITFMIPEHAVKAFTELDGTVFQVRNLSVFFYKYHLFIILLILISIEFKYLLAQGRMLHLLPGKEKKENEEESKGILTVCFKMHTIICGKSAF